MSDIQHRARKRFGQNFLRDPGVVHRIVRAINPRAGDHLVEIGPGQGALTELLVDSGCRLDVVELDRDLVPLLARRFGHFPNFRVHQGDALDFAFDSLVDDSSPVAAGASLANDGAPFHKTGAPLRVVGNLPYNISTPLIFHLLAQRPGSIRDMHFMLQLEVVERLAAGPGSKAYGRLGIMAQYHCRVEALFEVPPEAFSPRPKVQSAVVRLTPHAVPPHSAADLRTLETVVRSAFNQRRKTLRNALKGLIDEPALRALAIDPGTRPEQVDLAGFVAIANHIVHAGR